MIASQPQTDRSAVCQDHAADRTRRALDNSATGRSLTARVRSVHRVAKNGWGQFLVGLILVASAGCQTKSLDPGIRMPFAWNRNQPINFAESDWPGDQNRDHLPDETRIDLLAGNLKTSDIAVRRPSPVAQVAPSEPTVIVRAQSPQEDDNSFSPGGFGFPENSPRLFGGNAKSKQPAPQSASRIGASLHPGGVATANYQTTDNQNDATLMRDDQVQPAQFPEFDTPGRRRIPGNGLSSPNIGSPNEMNPLVQPFERGGNASFPMNYADLDIYVAETNTGRFNFGGAYNSDNGIVGQFTIDERNFDILRFPRSIQDIVDGTAWRGAGQHFHLELVPGANLERYMVSFTEPFLAGTEYSLSVSAYLFDRNYFDWDEERLGGRVAIGRRLTHDISVNMGVRLESVTLDNARTDSSPQLNDSVGTSNLFLFNAGLVRDTRDSVVAATEGTFLSLNLSQAFGDYDYTRGDLDFRTYRLLYERPDGSGRHTLSYGTKVGFSGSSTPIFENYFAGGFSTLRGFDFRGAAPNENGVRVGGEFQWLNTVEYMFPITADDALKGVVFCDFGTVEESIELNSENFRVAPGFGFRVAMPGQAGGAPLAFDFAFPIATADGDEEKVFSFYLGVLR